MASSYSHPGAITAYRWLVYMSAQQAADYLATCDTLFKEEILQEAWNARDARVIRWLLCCPDLARSATWDPDLGYIAFHCHSK